jgi:hypothetical protein
MVRSIPLILATGLVIGCVNQPLKSEQAAPPPQTTERARHSFLVGMSRKEVRKELADSWLLVSASRPVSGWSKRDSPPAGGRVVRFESSHPGTVVEECEVYWVGHTNAPRMYYGIWLSYYYFDRDEKLIAFDRSVID